MFQRRSLVTLWEMHVKNTMQLRKEHEALFKKPLLDGKPQMKGVVIRPGILLLMSFSNGISIQFQQDDKIQYQLSC